MDITLNVLLPILVLVLLGVWMRRQFSIDLGTLSKLNLYLFVPGYVYQKVATSSMPWSDMGAVVGITTMQVVILGAVVWWLGRLLRVPRQTLAAVAIAVMFYNSGNYGLPLAELAYPAANPLKQGGAAQAFVMLTQNILNLTVGLAIAAAAGSAHWSEVLRKLIYMPVLPMLAAALITRGWIHGDASRLPIYIAKPAQLLADGLLPLAIVTMGAQLGANPRWPRWRPVSFVIALRLFFAPLQMLGMLWFFHWIGWKAMDVWPWPAEMLILSASVPSAVNNLLITMEMGGDAELAADCVFWTTIVSVVTIAAWLVVLRHMFV